MLYLINSMSKKNLFHPHLKPNQALIIAEIGLAHDGSLGMAHSYIDTAAKAGATAIKFQTHIAESEGTSQEKFRVPVFPQDKTRQDYWKRTSFSKNQWIELKKHAEEKNLIFLSTPFSMAAVELLEEIDIPAWKIGSGDTDNIPLLEKIIQTKKPILLSTGMSYEKEIKTSVDLIKNKKVPLILFQCTSQYPCVPENWGLNVIQEFENKFKVPVGFSDHSGNIFAGIAARTLGAQAIEVHLTFHKESFGPDVSSSLTPEQLTQLVEGIRCIEKSFHKPINKDKEAKKLSKVRSLFRKSIVTNTEIKSQEVISREKIDFKKPCIGIPASDYQKVLNKKSKKILKEAKHIQWKDLI